MVMRRSFAVAILVWCATIVCDGCPALATPSPADWTLNSFAAPTNFTARDNKRCEEELPNGGVLPCDAYTVRATNAGSAPTGVGNITLTDTLPEGVTVQKVSFFWSGAGQLAQLVGGFEANTELNEAFPHELGLPAPCGISSTLPAKVECTFPSEVSAFLGHGLQPDETLKLRIFVTVDSSSSFSALTNRVTMSGGGVPEAAVQQDNAISNTAAPFGPSNFSVRIAGWDGAPDTQAGDHPYELTADIGLDNTFRVIGAEEDNPSYSTSVQDVKDVIVDLPLGFVGSTLSAPQCTFAQLASNSRCPADTVVGHIETEPIGNIAVNSPIYNMTPERGVAAEFGYVDTLQGTHVFYAQVAPSPEGYVIQTTNPDVPAAGLAHVAVTFYGDPAAKQNELAQREGKAPSPLAQVPFFTNPTDCSAGPLITTMYMDSWQNPGTYNPDGTPDFADGKWVKAISQSPPVLGCNVLQFPAEVQAQPTTHEADKPSGMEFEVRVPQAETVGVPASPTLKKAVVVLPEGFTVDPSAGDGLAACSEAQIGWLGGTHLNFNPDPPQCPEASKIGSLELETPLIPHKLEGEMFLARQDENPFGATLAAYVVVNDPITGVLAKIAGQFKANAQTGQLTAEFDENPNVPFSDLKLHFFGGPRAELATPESCGTFTTTTELTPYSAPDSGLPATPSDSFVINEACPSGFGPAFIGGSENLQAGAYTPFVASFSRADTDQELTGLSVTLPPGLLAKVAGVPLCGEAEIRAAEASTGGCPEASEVGTVKTGVGPGPDPLFVSGKAYLTDPYKGGPYGLAVIVPAIAGPYNFGTVVVRQSIRIDPRTAQVTAVSDAFPTIIDGIPLRLRRVDLTLDRPQFTFNPTSCEKEGFTGTISGSPLGAPRELSSTSGSTVGYATQAGVTAPIGTSFQVSDCASLKFAPKFAVATNAKASHLNGASLKVKLSYPNSPWGTQANIHRVKVSLPKQLPSRLKTLQKACTAAQFNANPAGCPAASVVGHALVHTPVLPTPLEGPAYFVSNGGEAFPNLIMVLQGDNVTVQLVGDTFISKKGITSSTFNAVPDVPFSSFELTLPKGQYSALAGALPARAHGSFCKQKLTMPTEFRAQSGLVIKETTKVKVSGCPRSRRVGHKSSRHHHRKR